ncbi:hypothetical protein MMC20_003584 [Loxospora ochrophaea]|nr:hypothetical protein [Loxospora ochrophaea]
METSLGSLSISSSQKPSKQIINRDPSRLADSWEEEASSGSEIELDHNYDVSGLPDAPPPTPISPTSTTGRSGWGEFENPYSPSNGIDGSLSSTRTASRPEKQTAVAGRMIAGALGVKAPKKTEEQRSYEKAVKEKEIRRREKEKEAKRREEQDAEKAKADMWDA